jgi:rod shape-determining protein MreC
MRRLLKIIQKYQSFVLFLCFQAICFTLIIRQNNFHQSSVFNASNAVVGSVQESIDNVKTYVNLRKENERLNEENAQLKTLLFGQDSTFNTQFINVKDSLKNLQYKYISGKVVNVFVKGENNFLTINLGSTNGIAPHMGVVGPKGIVGFTKDVSKHYSTVVPIAHRKFAISVAHKNSKSIGLLQWQGGDNFTTATVINLAKYVPMKAGDTIVSKGFDGIFNSGELVGYIIDIYSDGDDDYNTAKIKLFTDFNVISSIKVISNSYQKEQKELEETLMKEKE